MSADQCSSCGKQVNRSRNSRPQIICHDCRRKNPVAPAPRQPVPQSMFCADCGTRFHPKMPWAKFCSQKCRSRHNKSGRRAERDCPVCGKTYVPTVGRQKTCSRDCAAALRASLVPGPACPVQYANCEHCGALFIRQPRRSRRFCSAGCSDAGVVTYNIATGRRAWAPGARQCECGAQIDSKRIKCDACIAATAEQNRQKRRRAEHARRRHRKRHVPSEPYTLTEIAARDHWRCGLCGKPVARKQKAPHPRSPSIDHVIPIACGGDDTRANVQLAHFGCNVRKRDRGGGEQLALIG